MLYSAFLNPSVYFNQVQLESKCKWRSSFILKQFLVMSWFKASEWSLKNEGKNFNHILPTWECLPWVDEKGEKANLGSFWAAKSLAFFHVLLAARAVIWFRRSWKLLHVSFGGLDDSGFGSTIWTSERQSQTSTCVCLAGQINQSKGTAASCAPSAFLPGGVGSPRCHCYHQESKTAFPAAVYCKPSNLSCYLSLFWQL